MIPTPFNYLRLEEEDLLGLVGIVRENLRIDYKQQIYVKETLATEFSKDVTAFANIDGGCILIGIEEVGGVAERVSGIEIEDPDKAMRQMQQSLVANTRPVPIVRFHAVKLRSGRLVLVVAVPSSLDKPHAVTAKWPGVFYKRTDGATIEIMDVEEIRRAMRTSESIDETARRLHARAFAGKRFGGSGVTLFLSLVPMPIDDNRLDFGDSELRQSACLAAGYCRGGAINQRLTFDGLVAGDFSTNWFHQRFTRSGAFFGASHMPDRDEHRLIRPKSILADTGQAIDSVFEFYAKAGIVGPVVGVLMIGGCTNRPLVLGQYEYSQPVDLEAMEFPPVVFEDISQSAFDSIRDWADRLWQAGGIARCPYYERPSGVFRRTELSKAMGRPL